MWKVAAPSSRAGVLLALLALVAATMPLMPTGESQSLTPHPPILIDGDADLCDAEDLQTGGGDGIVNCATADGSAERPYVIDGWSVSVLEKETCVDVSPCALPTSCAGFEPIAQRHFEGAISVCGTARHIVLRDLSIRVGSPALIAQSTGPEPDEGRCLANDGCVTLVVGLVLWGASNVTVERTTVSTSGLGAFVSAGNDGTRTVPASNVTFSESRLESPSAADLSQSEERHRTLLTVLDADVALVNSTVEAAQRSIGVFVDATASQANGVEHTFRVSGSTVSNATLFGLQATEVRLVVIDSGFLHNGQEAEHYSRQQAGERSGDLKATPSASVYTAATNLSYEFLGNRFVRGGVGLMIEGSAAGRIEGNRFDLDPAGRPDRFGVYIFDGCLTQLHYNDFDGMRLAHGSFDCSLDARLNWWSSADGPRHEPLVNQAEGRIEFDPWLVLPIASLPTVRIVSPADGAEASGAREVRGEASSPEGNELTEIQLTRTVNDWSSPVAVKGTSSWSFTWDLDQEPLGPLSLWVRACGRVECGPPERLDVVHVENKVPPLALLAATPRSVRPGDVVVLDATASYSPQGKAIEDYRFEFGDGRATEWIRDATVEVVYEAANTYTASVQVRDEAGVTNTNVANVVVRVGDGGVAFTDSAGKGSVPAVEAPLLLAVLLGAALLARRRAA